MLLLCYNYINMTEPRFLVESHFAEVSQGLNESLGLNHAYDQTKGNRCDLLTQAVMQRMANLDRIVLRRELHQNDTGDWHYMLAHEPIDTEPTNNDLMSDLNPWQWSERGRGILHMPRGELMEFLTSQGAPEHFVALRAVETIVKAHDTRSNPFIHPPE